MKIITFVCISFMSTDFIQFWLIKFKLKTVNKGSLFYLNEKKNAENEKWTHERIVMKINALELQSKNYKQIISKWKFFVNESIEVALANYGQLSVDSARL